MGRETFQVIIRLAAQVPTRWGPLSSNVRAHLKAGKSGAFMVTRLINVALSLALLSLASACGGDHDLRPDEGAARFYDTQSFRGTRALALLTFEGGLVYGFYQSDFAASTYPEYAYAGFFVAQPPLGIGTEYNFEDGEASAIRLELGTQSGSNVFGTLKQVPPSEDSTFSVRESANAQLPTDPALLPGAYSTQARAPGESFKAAGVLDAVGNLSVTSGACTVVAKLSPRQLGNLYDAAGTIGPNCNLGTGSYSGHAMQAHVTRNIYLLLTAPGQQGVMLLLVPKAP